MKVYAERLQLTREARSRKVIRELLAKCKKPYVAWSGGKDSTLMLYFALKEKPDIEAVYLDAEASLPDTEQFIRKIVKEWNINFRRLKTRPILEVFKQYGVDAPNIEYQTMKATVYEPIKQLVSEGYDGALVGIRAEESRGRRTGGRNYGELFYAKRNRSWQGWPMLWWRKEEIWAYIDAFNIPYNTAYDKTAFGPREEIRVSYWAGESNRQFGRWMWLKYYYPDLFNRFAAEFPEVRHYV